VRVLLDENLPRQLKRDLPDMEIKTVAEVGWAGIKNGQLLRLAEATFDVFVTADQNLSYQQPVANLQLGIVVLKARTTKLEDLKPLMPALWELLREVKVGQVYYVGPP
jgi:predicted nuclease of predicted toxin-antitoxin system